MAHLESFTRQNIVPLRASLESALAAVAAEYGVDVKLGSLQWESGSIRTRVELTAKAGADEARSHALLMAKMHGIDGSGTTANGLTLTGYNHRAPAKPWVLTNAKGEGFKAPTAWLKTQFPAAELPDIVETEAPVIQTSTILLARRQA
jgi:hypothetical protein